MDAWADITGGKGNDGMGWDGMGWRGGGESRGGSAKRLNPTLPSFQADE